MGMEGHRGPREPNRRLAELIAEAGCSNAGLARRVNMAGAELGLDLRYDKTSVARWLLSRCHPDGGFVATPTTPVPDITPLSTNVDQSLAPQRFTTELLTGFAAVALLLASVGLFGVISFSVRPCRANISVGMKCQRIRSSASNANCTFCF